MIAATGRGEHRRSADGHGSAQAPSVRRAPEAFVELGRRLGLRPLALLCVLLGASLLGGAPALAASQRGHVFSFAFGETGSGNGQLSHPSGIAVSSSTGDVYVVDRENGRVEEFKPLLNAEGEPEQEEYAGQFAVLSPQGVAVDNCTSGSKPCAGDPSLGDVYVVGAKKVGETQDTLVYKFSATGAPIGSPQKFKSAIKGIAVDQSGNLFVYQQSGAIARLNDAEANEVTSHVQSGLVAEARPAFAVDSEDDFYVGAAADETEAGGNEPLKELLKELQVQGVTLIAKLGAVIGKKGTAAILLHELSYEDATAVAVNPANVAGKGVNEENDAYVANVASAAGEKLTTIAAFSPAQGEGSEAEGEGKLIQRFGAPGLREGDGVAVDPASGVVYVADGASNRIYVFELEPPGKPTIGGLSSQAIPPPGKAVANATRLSAQVNPAGSDTHYHFEYGTSSCTEISCSATPSIDVGEGFGDRGASVELQNLQPGAYHYRLVAENAAGSVDSAERTFTILASLGVFPDGRAWEMVSPSNKDGAEPEALTKEGGQIQASASGDAITYVADGPMPAEGESEGGRNPEFTQILSTRGAGGWATQDIATSNATAPGVSPGEPPEYRLFSQTLALALVDPYISESGPFAKPPLSPPLPGEEAGEQENTIYLRSDAPLSPGAPEAASYEKARENGNNMKPRPNPGFLPLVTKANAPGPGFGREIARQPAGIVPAGATPDLSHVVFASELVANGLYEWSGGENQLVSVIEEGGKETRVPTPAEAHLGSSENLFNRSMNVRHAISNDGSRVFWTYKGVHLEVRDTETRETLQLDTVQPEASGAGEAGAVFQTANGEGTRVFFTDGQRLTADSGATASAPDLYVADVSVAGGHVSSAVTDLTPHGGEGADVLLVKGGGGGVIGASEDGSYVYFVANGALTPDAARGRCSNEPKARPRGTTCNLYVRHHNDATGEWEPTKLIAALSFEDMPDWGGGSTRRADFAYMTSRVSPNGRYLAFMSNRSLTGYDNEDVSGKGRLDEEVFLYDANEQRLVCVSCNPTGARPRGVFDAGLGRGGKGEGLGLVADRPEIWSEYRNVPDDHWLAGSIPGWTSLGIEDALYQSRYLLDSGRLYFNSADALVSLKAPTRQETVQGAEQEVGVENVYEYEPNATGGCQAEGGCVGLISSGASQHESAFLDASASGNDVFFLTAGKLSPRDVDTSFDVYDAHVCGSECPSQEESSPPPCQEEACQGSFSPGPAFAPPASATSSGSGNIAPLVQVLGAKTTPKPAPKPLTRAQKLARALKACRKNKQRSKRLACERQARKKYGPVKPTAKKSSTKATG